MRFAVLTKRLDFYETNICLQKDPYLDKAKVFMNEF
jgi:hypothetical protein